MTQIAPLCVNPQSGRHNRNRRSNADAGGVVRPERDRLFGLAKQFVPDYADYELLAGGRRIPSVAFTEDADSV